MSRRTIDRMLALIPAARRELLFSSVVALFTKGIGAIAGFAASLMVARILGAEQAGLYFLAFAIISVLAGVSRIGLDSAVLRLVSASAATRNMRAARSWLQLALGWAGALALLFSVATVLFAGPIATYLFGKSDLEWPLRVMAMSIPLISLSTLQAQTLQGLHRYSASVYVLNISANMWLLIALLLVLLSGIAINCTLAAVAWVFACTITLLTSWRLLAGLRHEPPTPGATPIDARILLQSCMPLFVVDTMTLAVQWASQLAAGAWLAPVEIAWLGAAQRIAMLTALLLLAINVVMAPRFSALHAAGKSGELRDLAQFSARMIAMTSLPLIAVMLIWPEQLLALFGEDFRGGAPLLPILALGQLVNALTGSVGFLLIMSGHERDMRNIMIITGVIAMALPLALLPVWGAAGAAAATALAVATQNLLAMYLVRKRLGFWTISLRRIGHA